MANPNILTPIVGQWYQLANGRQTISGEFFIEYKDSDGNIVHGSRHIDYNKNLCNNGNFSEIGTYTLVPIAKSRIQQWLPKCEREEIINEYEIY